MLNIDIYAPIKYGIVKKNIILLLDNLKKELNFTINDLQISIIDKESLLKINIEFLGHNYDTDIITFNYNENNVILEGEILISYDMALENAKRFNCSLNSELIRLIIHGILHLLGYNDIEKEEKKIMKRKENLYVKMFEYIKIVK